MSTSQEEYIKRKKAFYEARPELKEEYDKFLASLEDKSPVPSNPTPPPPPLPKDMPTVPTKLTPPNLKESEFVFFSSDKCGFCKKFQPIWDEVSPKYPDAKFRKITVQNEDDQKEFQENKVGSYPMVIFFEKGKEVSVSTGYKDAENFETFVKDTIEGKFTPRQQRNQQAQGVDMESKVLKVPLTDYARVHALLFTAKTTQAPLMFDTMLHGGDVIMSFTIRKGVRIHKDAEKFKMT